MASGFFAGNQHNDVLHATPKDAEDKARLVDELKRRGNAAFKVRSLPEAISLYSKAIEHNPKAEALLSNRSMAYASMGEYEKALRDAEECTKLNPAWAKGFFRKANAEIGLHLYDCATESLEKVLALEPSDKSARKLKASIPEKRKAHEEETARRKARLEKDSQERAKELATDRVISKKIVQVGKEASAKGEEGTQSNGTTRRSKGGDDGSMRGYKVLADGRKTTFFNRELSEQDKKLLGEIKHEKLRAPVGEKKLDNGASAWNTGGTFEERNFTEWGTDKLKTLLKGVSCPVSLVDSDGDTDVEDIGIRDIVDFEGDASIAFTRGKKRHIFDFNFSVKWSVSCDGTLVSGTIFFPDVSGDAVVDDEVVEAELRWSNREKAGKNRTTLEKILVDPSPKGLLGRLNHAIHKFAAEFREIA